MEYLADPSPQQPTVGKILCCECGLPIEPNSANMCIACVRRTVDITEGIPRQGQLNWCKICDRYFQPPNAWLPANLESKELLTICLKKLKAALGSVRLVDAGFIWTEPHSRRIKVKLTVQKEIMGGAVLQQVLPVEFVVQNQMCDDCRKVENKDYWRACVQVRQRCDQKKTLFYLEQLILKHKAHAQCTGVKPIHGGLDFYFWKQSEARKLVDFLTTVLPAKSHHSQELVTHDPHNNTYDYKHTYCVEIVPISKDNVVCVPKKTGQALGNLGQILVCVRVSDRVHLIDPNNGQVADVSGTVFWRHPFESLCQSRDLKEFTVIDVEPLDRMNRSKGHAHVSTKHGLADVWLMRTAELGASDGEQISARTHLGHLLHPGDTVLGLDIRNCNVNNAVLDQIKAGNLPDVILVKKVYDRAARRRRRNWKLRRLNDQLLDTDSQLNDYNEFLEDLEEDAVFRQNVNIYKAVVPVESASDESEVPAVSLQEMLDDLVLDDEEMPQAS